MTKRYEELYKIAIDMGMTPSSAKEMAEERIQKENEELPRYVKIALNATCGTVENKKLITFLDKRFGFNSQNVHEIYGYYVNRDALNNWYVC